MTKVRKKKGWGAFDPPSRNAVIFAGLVERRSSFKDATPPRLSKDWILVKVEAS